jgi:hypothetical protein
MVQITKNAPLSPSCDGRSDTYALPAGANLGGAERPKFDKAAARAEQARLVQNGNTIDLLTTGLDGLESVTRFIRDGSIILGEQVAMRVGGPIGSAGFRLVVGSASSLAEETMSVALGLKTVDEGFSDLSWSVTQNSLSAVTDLGGGKLAAMAAKRIGGEISGAILSKAALSDQVRGVVMTSVGNTMDALAKTARGEEITARDLKHYALNYGTAALLAGVGTQRNFYSTAAGTTSRLIITEASAGTVSTAVSLGQAHVEGGITQSSFLACLSNGGNAYANVRHGMAAAKHTSGIPRDNATSETLSPQGKSQTISVNASQSSPTRPHAQTSDVATVNQQGAATYPHAAETVGSRGVVKSVVDVTHSINSRQVLVRSSDVENVLVQFPADHRVVATQLLAHTAETGSYHGLNKVMEQLTAMGVKRDGVLIIDNGPGSLTDALSYLHNRSYLQSYQNIPTNPRQDSDHRRLVLENFRTPNYYTHVIPPEGQAVLVLDHHALTKFNSTAQGQNHLLKMLEDPNLSILVPVGRNLGTEVLSLSPETSAERLKPVVADTHHFMAEGFSVADAMNLSLIKHDPVIRELRALDPQLLQRTQLVGLVAADDPTHLESRTTDGIAHLLSGKPRTLSTESLQKIHDQCPTALQPHLLRTLDEQASLVTIPEMRRSLRQLRDEIRDRAGDREVFYLVPEGGKSYGFVTHMMKELDPNIRPEQVVRPQDLAERLNEREQRWNRDARRLGRKAGPRPDHSAEVVVAILDDFAGSGRSLGKAVDSARTLLQDPEVGSPVLFHGEVIVAPLFMTSGAEHAIKMDDNKRERGRVTVISSRTVPNYTESRSYADSPTRTFEVHGGVRNLGYENGGLVFTLPYTSPNNNSLLGKWLADEMLARNAAKPPHGATYKSYAAYLGGQAADPRSVRTPLREVSTGGVSSP